METGSRIMIQALLEMCTQYKGRGSENAATTATGSGMSEGRFSDEVTFELGFCK